MSNNNGGWKPRKLEMIECPSGQKVQVRRPGPEFTLKAGRIPQTFRDVNDPKFKKLESETDDEYNQRLTVQMTDEEQEAAVAVARELLVASVVLPRLSMNPGPGELHPDDTGIDFWFLYNYAYRNFMGIKVPVGDEANETEAEVEVKDLESFREESGVSGDSLDSVHVPITEPERATTDQGLVDSAGA